MAAPRTDRLAATLTIAVALVRLREDSEAFARLIVALARIRDEDAAEVARLLIAAESNRLDPVA
jgi:hypothetical protein